jgi:hypothetical protein
MAIKKSVLKTKTLAIAVTEKYHKEVFEFCERNELRFSSLMENALKREIRNLKKNHGYK